MGSNILLNPRTGQLDHYTSLALYTAAPLEGRMNLVHALMGVSGELLETYVLIEKSKFVDDISSKQFVTDLMKELGDIMWFLALHAHYASGGDVERTIKAFDTARDVYFSMFGNRSALVPNNLDILTTADRMVALAKKEVCYNKQSTEEQSVFLFAAAWAYVAQIVNYFNLDLDVILELNIKKLYARYEGQAYTQAAATEHDSQ